MEDYWNCVSLLLPSGRHTIIDADNFEWLSQYSWCAARSGRNKEYVYIIRNRTGLSPMSMHREVMNAQKGELIDHRNGNQVDNREGNLRRATKSQNKQNSKKCTRAYHGKQYKGIGEDRRYPGRFFAAVYQGRRKIYGKQRSDTPEEAAREYDRLALEYYGEFASLNFPLSGSNDEQSK